jgi:hypothetical protein
VHVCKLFIVDALHVSSLEIGQVFVLVLLGRDNLGATCACEVSGLVAA